MCQIPSWIKICHFLKLLISEWLKNEYNSIWALRNKAIPLSFSVLVFKYRCWHGRIRSCSVSFIFPVLSSYWCFLDKCWDSNFRRQAGTKTSPSEHVTCYEPRREILLWDSISIQHKAIWRRFQPQAWPVWFRTWLSSLPRRPDVMKVDSSPMTH